MPTYYRLSIAHPAGDLNWEDFERETEHAYIRPGGTRVMKGSAVYEYFTNWQDAKQEQLRRARKRAAEAARLAERCAQEVLLLASRMDETPKEAAVRAFNR
jgi:hypothetical protein